MSVLGTNVLTLADLAKLKDPSGKTAKIVEMLSQTNEILEDIGFKEGNLDTGEETTVRTGLPSVAWRLINQGVSPSKGTTAQVREACGMLTARSEIDCDLANQGGDQSGVRLSEAYGHFEALNQEFASTLFYGNTGVNPEEILGFAPRYSSLSAANARNIVDAGGTGSDNCSIWLVVWHEQSVYGITPKGSMAGIQHKDLGEIDAFDSQNRRFRAYADEWKWKVGLTLKDWRQAVRICNIDVSNLIGVSGAADIIEYMIKATYRIQTLTMGKACWYMNRTCAQMLEILSRNDVISGGGLVFSNVDGKPIRQFRGIPIRVCDALLETEARVT